MRLLVPFASGRSEAARAALGALALPRLDALLADGRVAWRDEAPPDALSPPHERALARLRGWTGADGALPFAAAAVRAAGRDPGASAWALLVPVHWSLGREHALLADPETLALEPAEAHGLFDAIAPLFTSTGFEAVFLDPLRWAVGRDDLEGLPAASPDRAIGLPVSPWLARPEIAAHPASRALKRLLSEAQLALHAHPVNDAREARGLPPVNALWLHGAGREQPIDAAAEPVVDDRLRAPFLAGDWAAWAEAWAALDAGPVASLHAEATAGRPASLVLCGEDAAVGLDVERRPALRRAWAALAGLRTDAARVLEAL